MSEVKSDEWVGNQLAKIAKGGQSGIHATTELYRALDKRILRFLLMEGVQVAVAEEILQTAFIKIFERANQWRGKGSASAWLWTIVRNTRTDYYRRGTKEVGVDDAAWQEIGDIPDSSIGRASAIPVQECVSQALQRFSKTCPERAEALRLLHLEEWSIAQVAQFLGRTQAATKEYLSQCRKHFRPFVQPCLELLEP